MTVLELKISKQDTFNKIKYVYCPTEKDVTLLLHLFPHLRSPFFREGKIKDFNKYAIDTLSILCKAHGWKLDINARKSNNNKIICT
jgi:hypothetical protein